MAVLRFKEKTFLQNHYLAVDDYFHFALIKLLWIMHKLKYDLLIEKYGKIQNKIIDNS